VVEPLAEADLREEGPGAPEGLGPPLAAHIGREGHVLEGGEALRR